MMVATVLVAGYMQAAAVAWNSGAMTGPSNESLASSTAYLATIYFFSDAGGTMPIAAGAGAQISDDTASSSGVYVGTTANNFASSQTAYAQMVLTSDDGEWIRTSQIRQFTTPANGNLIANFGSGLGFLGGTAAGSLWTGTTWEPVPEPTSLALLAIGAAAIGFRRKLFKK